MRRALWFMLLSCLVFVGTASATYTKKRAAISTSGGTAAGGPFRLNFTIGQGGAGKHSAATTQITSGFWWEIDGAVVDAGSERLPNAFALEPSVPNPFGAHTLIRYAIPDGDAASVSLSVYDLRGALIRSLVRQTQAPGTYSITWDGRTESGQFVHAGIYFVRIEAAGFRQYRRVAVVR